MHQTPSVFLFSPFSSVRVYPFEMTTPGIFKFFIFSFFLLSQNLGLSPDPKKSSLVSISPYTPWRFFPPLLNWKAFLSYFPFISHLLAIWLTFLILHGNDSGTVHQWPLFPNSVGTIKSLFTDPSWLSAPWHQPSLFSYFCISLALSQLFFTHITPKCPCSLGYNTGKILIG